MESFRSFGPLLITAPSDSERLYEMSVRMTRAELKPKAGYALYPWLTLRANIDTGDVSLAAGVKAKHEDDEDGA